MGRGKQRRGGLLESFFLGGGGGGRRENEIVLFSVLFLGGGWGMGMGDEELMWRMMILEVLTHGNCWFIRVVFCFVFFFYMEEISNIIWEKKIKIL